LIGIFFFEKILHISGRYLSFLILFSLIFFKLSNNNCIGIFIDGTRQKNGRVNKPKQGAALLAFKNQKLLLPVAIVNSHRLIRFKFGIPFFSKIVIKVGKPILPPKSSSRDDLNSVTINLQENINNLIE